MDLVKHWNSAVQYLEDHLTEEISLETAARIAGMSLDGFRRFFGYLVEMSPAEYVHKRRLSAAAEDLRRGSSVLDTALRYGYESPDAFSRAFARQHGLSPAEFRKTGGPLKLVPPVSFHITVRGAKEVELLIKDVPETVVFGISKEFDRSLFPDREALHQVMWAGSSGEDVPARLCEGRWDQLGNKAYDGVWFGLWRNGRYLIGREPGLVKAGGVERQVIPAGTYAVFVSEKGGYAGDELPRLFEAMEHWLPTSGCRQRGEDIVEIYHLCTDKAARGKNRWYEVWLPIETA